MTRPLSSYVLEELARHAALAPSSHNTQPWRFEVYGSRIDLHADRRRALPVNDPHDRELTISCGCALLNLRVAAVHTRLDAAVELLPDGPGADRLASVALSPTNAPGADPALYTAIARRHTHRHPFGPRAVAPALLSALAQAARQEGAWLEVLASDEQRRSAAELVAEGDAAQWSDPRWRRELAHWMHPRRRGDGLTVAATPLAQLVVRTFDMGRRVGASDLELALASPVLAVLGTDADAPLDWLRAGQALERVLLVACGRGAQASYLNQPVQVECLRPRLATIAGHDGFPQVLLRLGHTDEYDPPAPRRPVGEVIDRAALGREQNA